MANSDTPMGFQPYRHRGGGVIRASKYLLASAYNTALYTGDAVVLTSGKLAIAADNSATILGVFAGCQFLDNSGVPGGRWSNYWPASQATTGSVDAIAYVWDDPMITYRCQSDTDTAFVIASHIGNSYDLETDHTGSASTGISGMEIDLNDSGTGQWTVLGLIDEPGNAVGVNAKLEVRLKVGLLG